MPVRSNVRGIVRAAARDVALTNATTICPSVTWHVREQIRRHVGHHVPDRGAVLVAVNASARGADRAVFMTRLRALTASARSAFSRIYVMADLEWLTLTRDFLRA